MDLDGKVAAHYRRGGLERAILDALAASGRDTERIAPSDLSGVDEFHLGWRPATTALAAALRLGAGMRVLDIGAGLGGPARYFVEAHGCRVAGIDLTADYVAVARALTWRCGLADRVSFCQASGLALPFAAASFDRVTLIHVGMNIRDKGGLFAEVRRVPSPAGRFGLYDIMRVSDDALAYPTPWAASAETSFVEPVEIYRRLLAAAGFAIEDESDWRARVLALGREMRDRAAADGPPALGPHILMGPTAAQRLANLMAALVQGALAPVMIVARRQD